MHFNKMDSEGKCIFWLDVALYATIAYELATRQRAKHHSNIQKKKKSIVIFPDSFQKCTYSCPSWSHT